MWTKTKKKTKKKKDCSVPNDVYFTSTAITGTGNEGRKLGLKH